MGANISQLIGQITEPCCTGGLGDESSTEAQVGAYIITLDRTSGDKLGLDVEERQGTGSLPIKAITGGLAAKWNESKSQKIIAGDHIIQINGVKGDVAQMMRKCRTDKKLILHIMPANMVNGSPPSAAVVLPPAPSASHPPYEEATAYQAVEAPEYQETPRDTYGQNSSNSLAQGFQADPTALRMLRAAGVEQAAALMALEGADNNLELAMEIAGVHNTEPAPAPVPPARAPPATARDPKLQQLTEIGFAEGDAKRALQAHGGDVDAAMAQLLGGGEASPEGGGGAGLAAPSSSHGQDPSKVQMIVQMGFTEQQATDALGAFNGDVERASDHLLTQAD